MPALFFLTAAVGILLVITLQKLNQYLKILLSRQISIPAVSAAVFPLLFQRHSKILTVYHRLLHIHTIYVKGQVMYAFAVLVQEFSPGGRLFVGLD